MRRNWGLMIFTLVMALALVSGCAKDKQVLKESTTTTPGGKADWEVKWEAMEKERIAKEAAEKKAAAKKPDAAAKPAPAKAEWEIKWEAMEKERIAKEAAEKKAAAAEKGGAAKPAASKGEAAKPAASSASAKELYEFADVFFDFDKFNLKDDGRSTLTKHADWLNKNKNVTIVVEGHCDERGTAEYNLALGERRADAAAKYLISLGTDSKRVSTKSYGFERPLDNRHNEEAWAKNRRAHIVSSK